LAFLLAAAACAVPAVVGLLAFLNPLRQKSQAGEFMRLATLDSLPDDGTPRKAVVFMDQVDAWNRVPNQPVGSVYLRKVGKNEILALQVLCPHAGCLVSFDAEKKSYNCPCHGANFDMEGKRLEASSQSPRDLDVLEAEVRNGTEVWVRFQKFLLGKTEKVAEA
jgi:menaquinol-cytochrome c reductase iron-sulfur subunit